MVKREDIEEYSISGIPVYCVMCGQMFDEVYVPDDVLELFREYLGVISVCPKCRHQSERK